MQITYKKVVHETKSDRIGDVLVALSELRRNSEIPDDAVVKNVSGNFNFPRTLEITVEWKISTEESA